jgi:hypothetical protein
MQTTSRLSLLRGRAQKATILLSLIALVATGPAAFADATVSELMESGVYSEETKGDLDAAIPIYQQVVAAADAGQALAAQAQFRLAVCYDKKKDYAAATAAFEKLVKDYPNEKSLVALANEYLADGAVLLPAPWVDGEEMRYNVSLPTGFKVGVARFAVAAAELDGRKIWRFDSNVVGGAQSWSRTEVDAASFKPIRCLWKHTMMGEFDTVYVSGGADVKMKGKDEVKHFDLEGAVYDNEQAVQLMRRLPFATDYHTTLKIFVGLGGGSQLPVEVSVAARESVTVPAGTFDSSKVVLTFGPTRQTLWFSADEHRYLVKLDVGGAILELTAVKQGSATASEKYEDPACGFSVTVPAGWMTYRDHEPQGAGRAELTLFDADGVARTVVKVENLENFDAAKRESLRAFADGEISKWKKRLKDFAVRADGWTETTIAGQPALSFVADFEHTGKPQTLRCVYAFVSGYAVDVRYATAAEDFDGFRPQFDAVVASYRGK